MNLNGIFRCCQYVYDKLFVRMLIRIDSGWDCIRRIGAKIKIVQRHQRKLKPKLNPISSFRYEEERPTRSEHYTRTFTVCTSKKCMKIILKWWSPILYEHSAFPVMFNAISQVFVMTSKNWLHYSYKIRLGQGRWNMREVDHCSRSRGTVSRSAVRPHSLLFPRV